MNKSIKIALACLTGLPYLMRLWLVTRPLELLVMHQPLLEDDFFYYLNIARNIVRGKGVTADGVTPTNGFQAVHEWLCAAVTLALPSSPLTVMHGILIFQVAVSAVTAFVLYDILRSLHGRNTAAAAALIFSWWLPLFRYGNNGLETILQLFMLFCIIRSLIFWSNQTGTGYALRSAWKTGALAGIAIFVRVDMVILCLAIVAWAAGYAVFMPRDKQANSLRLAIAVAVCAVAGLGLDLLINHAINGHWFHDSGPAVRSLADLYSARTGRETGALQLLGESFSKSLFDLAPAQMVTVTDIPVPGERLALLLLSSGALVAALRTKKSTTLLIPLLLYCAILWSVYALGIRAYWFMGRYLLPMTAIISFLVFVPAAMDAIAALTRSWNQRATGLVVCVLLAVYCAAPALLWKSFVMDPLPAPRPLSNYDMARWIDTSLSREGRIATWQGGLISFMTGRDIIHLDGVVNREALEARESHLLGEYLQYRKIEYVADFRLMSEYLKAEISRSAACELAPYDSLISPDRNTDVLIQKVIYKR